MSENGNKNNSAIDSSYIVQAPPKKALKLSLPKKQHHPINANCSNESKTTSQTHLVTQVHVQTKQFTCGQILRDVTNTINHTKELHVDDSSVTSLDSHAKSPLPQGCTQVDDSSVTSLDSHAKSPSPQGCTQVDDSSVTSLDSQAKSTLPQGCTESCTPALSDQDSTTTTDFKCVLSWKQLAIPLQTVLPNDPKYTYVIEDFQPKSTEEFEGAPTHCFEAAIRINLTSEEEAKQWIQDMMAHSFTTY